MESNNNRQSGRKRSRNNRNNNNGNNSNNSKNTRSSKRARTTTPKQIRFNTLARSKSGNEKLTNVKGPVWRSGRLYTSIPNSEIGSGLGYVEPAEKQWAEIEQHYGVDPAFVPRGTYSHSLRGNVARAASAAPERYTAAPVAAVSAAAPGMPSAVLGPGAGFALPGSLAAPQSLRASIARQAANETGNLNELNFPPMPTAPLMRQRSNTFALPGSLAAPRSAFAPLVRTSSGLLPRLNEKNNNNNNNNNNNVNRNRIGGRRTRRYKK